jgi:hypothetical protein
MVQIQVYKQETNEQVYLDLLDSPDIQVNYQFADIKEPSKRTSDFTQTFKLPFSNTNNQFFRDIYDVNVESTDTNNAFDPSIKTEAVVLVDTVQVHSGSLQLKNIFIKQRLYEVVVFGEVANLFQEIKDKKLIEAFRLKSTGLLDTQYNHLLKESNIIASWTGTLVNGSGATKSEILYPIIDWAIQKNEAGDPYPFYALSFSTGSGSIGTGLVQTDTSNASKVDNFLRAHYLKPAITLKALIQNILKNNNYTYTSSFIDSTYFGKLFFQLATDKEQTITEPIGGFRVGLDGNQTLDPDAGLNSAKIWFADDSSTGGTSGNFYDVDSDFDTSLYSFTASAPATYQFHMNLKIITSGAGSGGTMEWLEVSMHTGSSGAGGVTVDAMHWDWVSLADNDEETFSITFQDYDMQIGDTVHWRIETYGVDASMNPLIKGGTDGSYIEIQGLQYNAEGKTVYIPDNCPDILIEDFLRDIVQRFNLCIVPSRDNPRHLTIEPLNDYIDAGSSKDWTDKLDLDKEQVVRFTNEYLYKDIKFTDEEDKDSPNNWWQNSYDRVWGEYTRDTEKEFAGQDELTNDPIFSPFNPTQVNNGLSLPPGWDKFLIHKAYELKDDKVSPIEVKPKLFYYSGSTTALTTPIQFYDGTDNTFATYAYYPFCSAFDSSPITSSTKSLAWRGGEQPFNFSNNMYGGVYSNQGLYQTYWARYLNELESDEARIMTCYLQLDETDILNFNFNDKIFIKDTYWRVHKIMNYVVGSGQPTKVELIKSINLIYTSCGQTETSWNTNGTVNFVNSETGAAEAPTKRCCEEAGYFFMNIPLGPWGATSMCWWELPSFGGNNFNITPTPKPPIDGSNMSLKKTTGVSNITKDSTTVYSTKNSMAFQTEKTYASFLGQTTTADLVSVYVNKQTSNGLKIPVNSFWSLTAEVMSVQVDTNGAGSVGATSRRVYEQAVKNVNGVVSTVGTLSRTISMVDSGMGTRDFTFEVNTTNMELYGKVQADANMTVNWIIEICMTRIPISLKSEGVFFAIYQDSDGILFQDGESLIYN